MTAIQPTTGATASLGERALSRLTLLGAVAAVVLGIFAMHALDLHGTAMAESHTMSVALTSPADDAMGQSGHGAHQGAATRSSQPVAQAPDLETSRVSVSGSGGAGMGDMVMLCVAMLAAAAVTLLLLLALTRRNPRSWAVARTGLMANLTSWRLPTGTGPPPTWKFSVIRC